MAFDIGGLGDKSFNDAANRGLQQAIADGLVCEENVVTNEANSTGSDRDQNMQALADAGFNLMIGVGFSFSPGVNTESGFEEDCAKRGMSVFLADRSVAGPAVSNPRFHFLPKFVGATSNDEYITLDEWVAASAAGSCSRSGWPPAQACRSGRASRLHQTSSWKPSTQSG